MGYQNGVAGVIQSTAEGRNKVSKLKGRHDTENVMNRETEHYSSTNQSANRALYNPLDTNSLDGQKTFQRDSDVQQFDGGNQSNEIFKCMTGEPSNYSKNTYDSHLRSSEISENGTSNSIASNARMEVTEKEKNVIQSPCQLRNQPMSIIAEPDDELYSGAADESEDDDMRPLMKEWNQTTKSISEKFREISKLLPPRDDEVTRNTEESYCGVIVGNIYDDEYGKLDQEKDCHEKESADVNASSTFNSQRQDQTTKRRCPNTNEIREEAENISELPVIGLNLDSFCVLPPSPKRKKCWQFENRKCEDADDFLNKFQHTRSIDYRSFRYDPTGKCDSTAGWNTTPFTRGEIDWFGKPGAEAESESREGGGSVGPLDKDETGGFLPNIETGTKDAEDDDSNIDRPTTKEQWLPHNRTQPAVKAVPVVPRTYDQIFDEAIDSSFPRVVAPIAS